MAYTLLGDAPAKYTLLPDEKPTGVSDSPVENFFAGLGKNMTDLALGAQQLGTEGLAKIWPQLQAKADALRQEAAQKKARDAALMDTTSGAAGNLTGAIGQSLLTLPVGGVASGLARIGLAVAGGAAQGAVKPVGPQDSRLANATVDGLLSGGGQSVANGIGAIVRPAVGATPEIQSAMDLANQEGGQLTRGQISNSEFTKRVEKILASMPGSGAFYKDAAEKNQNVVGNVVDRITGGGAGDAIQQFGQGKTVTLDPQLFQDLSGIRTKFASLADRDAPNGALKTIDQYIGTQGTPNPALVNLAPSAKAQAIQQGVPEFVGGTQGMFKPGDTLPMVGPQNDFNNYWALRSLYGQRAFGQGDPTDKAANELIRNALDRAAARSAVAQNADPAVLKQLRDSYGVEKTLGPAREVSSDGTVSYDPSKVANLIRKKDAKQTGYLDSLDNGTGNDIRQLADFVRTTQPVKSSGTAEGNIAGKFATLEFLKDFMHEGLGSAVQSAGNIAGLTMAPWLVNKAMQSTTGGIPLLRNMPSPASMTLEQLARSLPVTYQQN